MATPASFHHPDLPPRLPPPPLPLRRLLLLGLPPRHRLPPPRVEHRGFVRRARRLQAVAIPLLLTSLVYAGSFVARLWLLANSCGGGYEEPEIGWAQRLAHRIRASVGDVMVWRNCVVAPITEELVFRACMVPLLLCGGFKIYNIIFLSPVFFSLGVQLGYTVIFGWYAVFLFTRTGNIVSPIVAHIFCNIMGLPVFSSPQTRGVASVAFLAVVGMDIADGANTILYWRPDRPPDADMK
uniref:intramembrane prenyl-peptidase Rce1 n=1 Tax=Oryza barthii TaxID=65489 RepID=A0A0D3G6J2_9ORYZ